MITVIVMQCGEIWSYYFASIFCSEFVLTNILNVLIPWLAMITFAYYNVIIFSVWWKIHGSFWVIASHYLNNGFHKIKIPLSLIDIWSKNNEHINTVNSFNWKQWKCANNNSLSICIISTVNSTIKQIKKCVKNLI